MTHHLVGPTDLYIIAKAFTTLGLYDEITTKLIRYRECVERVIDNLNVNGRAQSLELQYHRLDLARANAEISRRSEIIRRVREHRS
jgi:hypothetical protein